MSGRVKGLFSKRPVSVIVILVLLVGGIALWFFGGRASAVQYITEPVERGSISNVVNATGTVQALLTVQVGSQISGQVEALYADFNSVVKRGQILAKLDPRNYQAALDGAKANLLSAQARVNSAGADLNSQIANQKSAQANVESARVSRDNTAMILKRQEELHDQGILSQNDYDNAKANAESAAAKYNQAVAQLDQVVAQINASRAAVAQAKAQVEQAQAALKQAQVNLDYTTITSPVDGVVISRNVDVGQTVAASLAAPTLFVIANDLTKMQVNASIDEADIGNINSVEQVHFNVDAYPNRSYTGRIAEIRLDPSTVQNVTTYSVIINVDNERLELKPGMTANISFTVAKQDNVLKIPNAAMRYLPPGVTREQVAEMLRKSRPAAPGAEPLTRYNGPPTTPRESLESDAQAMPTAADAGQAGRGEFRKSGNGTAAMQEKRGSVERPGNRGSTISAASRRAGPANQAAETELAPGQLWDPNEKIKFPKQHERAVRPGVAWVLNDRGNPEPRVVYLGITDGKSTQVVSGDLKESDAVIVGDSTQAAAASQTQQSGGLGGRRGGNRMFFGR